MADETTDKPGSGATKARVVLDVPYKQRDLAKAAGARWDGARGVWYVDAGVDQEKVKAWIASPERVAKLEAAAAKRKAERVGQTLLDVPYKQRDEAKKAGARWDGHAWYAPGGTDLERFKAWVPSADRATQLQDELAAKRALERPCRPLNAFGIRPETHNAPHFAGTWETDARDQMRFRDMTAPGGLWRDTALWTSNAPAKVAQIVLVERPEDAMAYHQLAPNPLTRYVAVGAAGHILGMKPEQVESLRALVTETRPTAVVAAFSNSRNGAELKRQVREVCDPLAVKVEPNGPTHGVWWTDTLQMKERDFIQSLGIRQPERGLGRSL